MHAIAETNHPTKGGTTEGAESSGVAIMMGVFFWCYCSNKAQEPKKKKKKTQNLFFLFWF